MTTTLPHQQTHNKAGTIDGKRNRRDKDYYHDVTVALEPAMEWLILGPSSARIELEEHVRAHHPELASRIIGAEAADHPTDNQIVAHERSFFSQPIACCGSDRPPGRNRMYKHILISTDGSERSEKAVAHGGQHLRQL